MQPEPLTPFVVRVVEEPTTGTGVVDVLLGIAGLIGVFMGVALAFGLLLGAVLVGIKKLSDRRPRATHASEDLASVLYARHAEDQASPGEDPGSAVADQNSRSGDMVTDL